MSTYEWSPCDLYDAYRCAREDAERALAEWRAVPVRDRREAFTTYRAAADREDAAAEAWLEACRRYDREHGVAA